jgi:acetyl esterase/lipase
MRRRLLILLLLVLCTASYAQKLVYYPAEGEPKAAVVVCPGGSYFWLDQVGEGQRVAEWLASEGIDAYVLHYRTAGWFDFAFGTRLLFGGNRHPDMISDLQWALQSVREEFDGPVGAMGFSAGGHLVMSAAEFFGTDFTGMAEGANLRPDFVAPIYPVVSMRAPCTHKRSRRGLLGEGRTGDQSLRDSLSLELHVRPDTPPVFLLRCDDDPVVDPQNADLLDAALTEKGIPHRTIRYRSGGHGFGADTEKFTEETAGWQAAFLAWMEEIDYGRH